MDDNGPTVRIAPPAPQIIPKSISSPGLLAHVLTGKLVDHLPFYRQEKMFERLGVDIGRATLCNWAMKAAEACVPLVNLIRDEILEGPGDQYRRNHGSGASRSWSGAHFYLVYVAIPPGRNLSR